MIRTADLTLRVAGRVLVERLDWQIRPGECWCIIGRNGAGKSTLLRTLAGLREADGGQVLLHDRALSDWPLHDLARERAYLAQSRNDAFGYSVADVVLAARHPYQDAHYWESDADATAVASALDALDIADMAQRDVRTLSGGERQRVAIAAVLAQDTPLLLLDEPATALDLAHQVSVMKLLAHLSRQAGKAVVMIGHDLNLAYRVSTHALLLVADGQWKAGPRDEVMQPEILGLCLDHPIEVIQHRERKTFVPVTT